MKVRWRVVAGLMAAPALLWMAPIALGEAKSSGGAASGRGISLAAIVADPLALWTQRSPGERGLGALLSTKPRRERPTGGDTPPTQRVLPTIRERPKPGPIAGEGPEGFAGSPPAPGAPPDGGLPGAPAAPIPISGAPGLPYFGPGPIGGGGGGGGPIPGGPIPGAPIPGGPIPGGPPPPATDTPPTPGFPDTPITPDFPVAPVGPGTPGGPVLPGGPPTPSPVPEPATWLTMILGTFAVGAALRRARQRAGA